MAVIWESTIVLWNCAVAVFVRAVADVIGKVVVLTLGVTVVVPDKIVVVLLTVEVVYGGLL